MEGGDGDLRTGLQAETGVVNEARGFGERDQRLRKRVNPLVQRRPSTTGSIIVESCASASSRHLKIRKVCLNQASSV